MSTPIRKDHIFKACALLTVLLFLTIASPMTAYSTEPNPVTPIIGLNTGDEPVTFENPTGHVPFAQISTREDHMMAISEDGTLYTWGNNSNGELGNGTTTNSATPTVVPALTGIRFTKIAAGSGFSMAVAENGTLYTWGNNSSGQLGNGTQTSTTVPTALYAFNGARITQIAAGAAHSMAVTQNGTVFVWGDNTFGQLGDGTNNSRNTPSLVPLLANTNIAQISAGNAHTMALATNGTLYIWGENYYGQLGDETNLVTRLPVQLPAFKNTPITQITAGGDHSIAVTANGTIRTWGSNIDGQLGVSTSTHRISRTPIPVPELSTTKIDHISANITNSMAVADNGDLYTWGNNDYGQLGLGNTLSTYIPTAVTALQGAAISHITSGGAHSAALTDDGTLYTWGLNNRGQLGNGTETGSTVPALTAAQISITKVMFGDTPGSNITDNFDGTFTATTPAHEPGVVDITIHWALNDIQQTPIVLPEAFEFVSEATVTPPESQTVTVGETATFTTTTTGTPTPTTQWEQSTDNGTTWTPIENATDTTLNIEGTLEANGNQYRVTATNTAGTTTSPPATLTVNGIQPIIEAPTDQTVTVGETATFTTTTTGTPTPTTQWEQSTDNGTTWTPIENATDTTLNIEGTLEANGNQYRVTATNTAGTTTSPPATLTVNGGSTPDNGGTSTNNGSGSEKGVHGTDGKKLSLTGGASYVSVIAAGILLLGLSAGAYAFSRKHKQTSNE